MLLAVIYAAFISLGLPDGALGVAWPFMRQDFGKPLEAAGLLTIILTICSAVSSIFGSRLTARFGIGILTLASCLMTAAGLLGYSLAPVFIALIPAVLLLGFGQGAIDAGLNSYVASHYSSRHMNWLHSCWGIGATAGPAVITAAIAAGMGWRTGYRILALMQGSVAVLLFLSLGLWQRVHTLRTARTSPASETAAGTAPAYPGTDDRTKPAHTHPAVCDQKKENRAAAAQVAIFALYVSCEFAVGLWGYSLLVESRGVSAVTAGIWMAAYYGAITGGRLVTGMVVNRLGNKLMIRLGLSVAFFGLMLLLLPFRIPALPEWFNALAVILIGTGFAPVYPCTSHETPRRFRPGKAERVMGYQVGAACLGGAFLPAAFGMAARYTTLEILPWTVMVLVTAIFILNRKVIKLTET